MFSDWDSPIVWIGATKHNGIWFWKGMTTGVMHISIWATGQPDNHGGSEFCVQSSFIENYLLNDASCSSMYQFICERQLEDWKYVKKTLRFLVSNFVIKYNIIFNSMKSLFNLLYLETVVNWCKSTNMIKAAIIHHCRSISIGWLLTLQ